MKTVLDKRAFRERLEKAITRLANAGTDSELADVRKAFPDLLPKASDMTQTAANILRCAWQVPAGLLRQTFLITLAGGYMQTKLGLWAEVSKEFTEASGGYRRAFFQMVEENIGKDGFIALAFYAVQLAAKMRHCQNPECPYPFYLRNQGGKDFCSKACAVPSQRAAKLEWWNQHKKELLARRRADYRKRTQRIRRRDKSQRRVK